METPVWANRDHDFAVMRYRRYGDTDDDDWTNSAFVVCKEETNSDVLLGAEHSTRHVQCLAISMDFYHSYKLMRLLQTAQSWENLRALWYEMEISASDLEDLAVALRRTPNLQQIKLIIIDEFAGDNLKSFFHSLAALPLTAIDFDLRSPSSHQMSRRFCKLLQQKSDTLISIEVGCNSRYFWGLFCRSLRAPNVQVLRLNDGDFNESEMGHLCYALDKMQRLRVLQISRVDSAKTLANFFYKAGFRPIRALACEFYDASETGRLLKAVSKTTKLLELQIPLRHIHCVFASGLLDEGYLWAIKDIQFSSYMDEQKMPLDVSLLLLRNLNRHVASLHACVALISARRAKKALTQLDVEIVRMIGMWIWDGRNDEKWDEAQKENPEIEAIKALSLREKEQKKLKLKLKKRRTTTE